MAVLVVGLASLAFAAVAPAAEQVYVEPGIYPAAPQVRPHELALSGDGTLLLYAIKYTSWGGPTAEATGRGYVRGCTPDCAQGKVYRPKAKIRLSRVLRCEGKLLYTRVSFSFTGTIPKGYKRSATTELVPFDKQGKPAC